MLVAMISCPSGPSPVNSPDAAASNSGDGARGSDPLLRNIRTYRVIWSVSAVSRLLGEAEALEHATLVFLLAKDNRLSRGR